MSDQSQFAASQGHETTPLVLQITERDSATAQRTFEIESQRCVIGSGGDADLQLRNSDVKPEHCEIVRNPAGVYVRELAEGMTVNGMDVDEAWIYQGDTMSFGNVEMKIEAIGKLLLEAQGEGGTEVRERETASSIEVESQSAIAESTFHTDFVIPAIDNPEDDFTQYSTCDTVYDIQGLVKMTDAQERSSIQGHEEAARIEAEQAEAARIEAEQAEAARIEAEQAEAARIEAEQAEAARIEAEQAEFARIEAEQAEAARIEAEQAEAARIEAEQAEAARIEAEQAEAARIEAEQAEAARIEAEQAEAARIEAEQAEAARIEAEQAEAARIEAEQAEAARIEAEQAEAARIEAEQAEAARIEAEQAEAARIEAEQAEAARIEAEQAEFARIEAEQAEAARIEAERAEAARIEAEQAEAARIEAEQAEAARIEAERAEASRIEAEQAAAARLEAEQAEAAVRLEAEEKAARAQAAVHDPFQAFASPNMTDPIDVALPQGNFTNGANQMADALARLQKVEAGDALQPKAPEQEVAEEAAQANSQSWLDELYESAIPEEQNVDSVAEQEANDESGWQVDPIISQLAQPNADPSQFTSLPEPSTEQAAEVLSQAEQLIQKQDDVVEQMVAAVSEQIDPQPVPPAAEDHLESTGFATTDQEEILSTFESDEPAAEASTFNVEPLVEDEEEPQTEQPAEAPVSESVADVLARMAAAGQLPNSIPADEDDDVPVSTPTAESPVATGPTKAAGGEDSVQDYMNQLMGRLRGNEADAGAATSVEEAPVDQATTTQIEEDEEDLTPVNPLTESEFKPKNVAREKSTTLDALRQIANQSVESAITASNKEKNAQTSLIYLGGTGACLFLSAVLFIMSKGVLDIAFILAVLFAIGCVAMGFMFVSINASNDSAKSAAKEAKRDAKAAAAASKNATKQQG